MELQFDDLNDMRLFASLYVEATDQPAKNKLAFLKFIKEADEKQLTHLLFIEGAMVKKNDPRLNSLSENAFMNFAKEYIAGMKASKAEVGIVKTGAWMGAHALMVSAVVAATAYAATKIYKQYISKAARACSGKMKNEKTLCMQKYKQNAMKMRISDMQKGKALCKKTKNPAKCSSAIDVKIAKLKSKM